MRIACGSDHAGFELKNHVTSFLRELRREFKDIGTHWKEPVACSDYAERVGVAERYQLFEDTSYETR